MCVTISAYIIQNGGLITMKKLIIAIIVASMFLVSCDSKVDNNSETETKTEISESLETKSEDENTEVEVETKSETEETEAEEEDKLFIIDEGTKFEKNNVSGEVKYLETTKDGAILYIDVYNNNEKTVNLITQYETINSYMVFAESGVSVKPGEPTTMALFFSKKALEESNIDKIENVGFKVIVYDSETGDELFRFDNVVVNVSKDGLNEEVAYEKKDIVLDQNGLKFIKIKGEKLDNGEYDLKLLAINNTGKDIFLSDVDAYVNDIKEKANFSANILSGKKAFIPIKFEDMTLKKYGDGSLDSVKLQISVFTEDLSTELFVSPLIFIKY